MINFVLAMLWISASWILLMASFCSIGFSAQRLFGFRGVNSESTLSAFWIGWCLVLMFLQVWHLVAPVDARVIGVLLIASVAGIAYSRQSIAELLELVKAHKLLLIAGSVLLLWLAHFCPTVPTIRIRIERLPPHPKWFCPTVLIRRTVLCRPSNISTTTL